MVPEYLRESFTEMLAERVEQLYLPNGVEIDTDIMQEWLESMIDLESPLARSLALAEGAELADEDLDRLATALQLDNDILRSLCRPTSLEVLAHVVKSTLLSEEQRCDECEANLEMIQEVSDLEEAQKIAFDVLAHVIAEEMDDEDNYQEEHRLHELVAGFTQLDDAAQHRVLASLYEEMGRQEKPGPPTPLTHLALWRQEYLTDELRMWLDLAVEKADGEYPLTMKKDARQRLWAGFQQSIQSYLQENGAVFTYPLNLTGRRRQSLRIRPEYLRPLRAILLAERQVDPSEG